jgi:membrane-bound acyltransferase YfiQ involved in biofilm formation
VANRSNLDAFREFLEQYRRLIVWAVAASAVPLAAALASMTPAWPSGIAQVTAVAQLLVLALVFQLLRSARRQVVSRIMVRWTIILCLLVPIYLMLIALFTYSEPISKMRFTKGFECTERAKQVFSKECPFLGTDEISTAGYEEDTLWTTRSVSAVKTLIAVLWLACFAALSMVLGSFAVFQMGQKNKELGGRQRNRLG